MESNPPDTPVQEHPPTRPGFLIIGILAAVFIGIVVLFMTQPVGV